MTAASVSLAIAACGSSSTSTTAGPRGGSGVSAPLVKYSACVRSHGVPRFPDPSTTQGPNSFGIDGYNFNLPSNLNPQSPAYKTARAICGHLLSAGGGAPLRNPALVARARRAALAHAECMRRHGMPNFPDPTFNGNSQGITVRSGGPGINPRSPAFQQAGKACAPAGAP